MSYMPLVWTSVKVPSYKLSLHPMYFVVTTLYRPTLYRETKSWKLEIKTGVFNNKLFINGSLLIINCVKPSVYERRGCPVKISLHQ